MDIYSIRRANLQGLIDQHAAGNAAEFARLVGRERSQIGQYLSATYNQGRSIGERVARSIEKSLSVPTGYLDKESHFPASEAVYVGLAPKQTLIPVVGIAQLGENGWYDEVQNIGSDGYIEHFSNDEDAYVLEVKGDSMFPAIRSGWYVVVEPNGTTCSGEYVAMSLVDGRKLVKELLFKNGDTVHLESVNGGERLTLALDEISTMHPVAAVVSPSKHRHG